MIIVDLGVLHVTSPWATSLRLPSWSFIYCLIAADYRVKGISRFCQGVPREDQAFSGLDARALCASNSLLHGLLMMLSPGKALCKT